jgi:hypothetical protein
MTDEDFEDEAAIQTLAAILSSESAAERFFSAHQTPSANAYATLAYQLASALVDARRQRRGRKPQTETRQNSR